MREVEFFRHLAYSPLPYFSEEVSTPLCRTLFLGVIKKKCNTQYRYNMHMNMLQYMYNIPQPWAWQRQDRH